MKGDSREGSVVLLEGLRSSRASSRSLRMRKTSRSSYMSRFSLLRGVARCPAAGTCQWEPWGGQSQELTGNRKR
jgi:hypothetical protein